MKSILKNTGILLAITLIAAVALAYVNELTRDPIAAANKRAKEEAYAAVYAGATFTEVEGSDALLADYNENPEIPAGTRVDEVLAAQDGGETVGYVMSVSSKGYGGDVKVALGVDLSGEIKGYAVLDCSGETAGFGARCKDPDIAAQFPGIRDAGELDGISGATHTTHALRANVRAALELVRQMGGDAS